MKPLVNVSIFGCGNASNKLLATGGHSGHWRGRNKDTAAVAVVGREVGSKTIGDFKAGHIQSGSAIPFVGIHKCHCPFGGMRTNVFEVVAEGFQTG